MSEPNTAKKKRTWRDSMLGLGLAGLAAGMVGAAFASVPLYKLICSQTAYVGTPRRAAAAPGQVLDRTIRIRFDGNVESNLPWTFRPKQHTIDLKIGATALAFFEATNNSSAPITGTAAFNVVPEIAARYFTKIQCFCFTQQTLKAGETAEMPVTFFVDPKIVDDDDTKNIGEITLSYTFFRSGSQPVAAVPETKSGS